MPIITVELVGGTELRLPPKLAQSLADTVGRLLDSPPGQTWVRLRRLERDAYAENESTIGLAEMPVFVTVMRRQLPSGAKLEAEVAALTHAIAGVIGRPAERVHIEYAPAAAGRMSFGGKIVQ